MPKLLGLDEWTKQIDQTIDRLKTVDCDNCMDEWLKQMKTNRIISDYTIFEDFINYTINGKHIRKDL